jgi:hypothetical protein
MAAYPVTHCPYQHSLSHCQPQPIRSLLLLARKAPAAAAAAGPSLPRPCHHPGVCIDPLDVACVAATAAVHFAPTSSPHAPPRAARLEALGRHVAAQSGRLRCGPRHARQRGVDSCCVSRNTCQRDVSSTVSPMVRTNAVKHLSQSSRLPLGALATCCFINKRKLSEL